MPEYAQIGGTYSLALPEVAVTALSADVYGGDSSHRIVWGPPRLQGRHKPRIATETHFID